MVVEISVKESHCGVCQKSHFGWPTQFNVLKFDMRCLMLKFKHYLQLGLDELRPSCCRWCREEKLFVFFNIYIIMM